jgi:DNA-binding NarL/FixJ family response regulator
MIRVLIADDQHLFRDGLRTLVNLEEDLSVVGTADHGEKAYRLTLELNPDVVLMDIRMPKFDGIEGLRLIRRDKPEVKVLMLTTFDDQELIIQALKEGASGYLLKDMPFETIASAIRTVFNGGVVLQPNITGKMLGQLTGGKQTEEVPLAVKQLTRREREVLALLGEGLNNLEIAEQLCITEGTVKNHVSNIISKLELRDRTQAAVYAVRHGLLSIEHDE